MGVVTQGGPGWVLEVTDGAGTSPASGSVIAWNLTGGPAHGLNGTGIAAVLTVISTYYSAANANLARGTTTGGPAVTVGVTGGSMATATPSDPRTQAALIAAQLGATANNF
jgi:hypothetical protein